MTDSNRRSFVAATATVGTLGFAGCLSTIDEWRGEDDGENGTENGSENGDEEDDTEFHYHDDLPGETVESFEDTDSWVSMIDAGSFDTDDDDPYSGSQSAHLTADEDAEYAGAYTTISDGMDLSDRTLSLAVKFTGREQLQLTLDLFAPNSGDSHTLRRALIGPEDRWVRVDFGTAGIDGDPDLTNVREIRLTVRRRGDDSGSIDCWIDDLRATERPETGAVMLLFDATLESHHATALDLVTEFDFAGVEAVVPEMVGGDGRLSLEEIDDLVDAGWDVAARPRTGAQNINEFDSEDQEGLIRQTNAWLENRGFEDGTAHFVTPRNVLGSETRDLVEEYHEQAFRYGGGSNGLPVTDPYNLGFFAGDEGEATTSHVDHAAEYGQLAVLHFEDIGADGMSEDEFEDLLEYIDDADVDVVTASELLEDS